MELLGSTWVIALAAFMVGAAIGILAYKSSYSDEAKIVQLEDDLEQKEHDFELYQQSVTAHFSKTSELVHNLTENYVEVYKHLATGSETLVDTKKMPPLLKQQQAKTLDAFISEKEEKPDSAKDEKAEPQPPKDYAAKEAEDEETKDKNTKPVNS